MRPYRHINMFKYQIKRVLLKINVVVYSLLFIWPFANQTNLMFEQDIEVCWNCCFWRWTRVRLTALQVNNLKWLLKRGSSKVNEDETFSSYFGEVEKHMITLLHILQIIFFSYAILNKLFYVWRVCRINVPSHINYGATSIIKIEITGNSKVDDVTCQHQRR